MGDTRMSLTREQIEACRRIGRDEVNRRSVIGLAELDALCDMALVAASLHLAQAVAHDLQDLARAIERGEVIGIEHIHWSPGTTAWTINTIPAPKRITDEPVVCVACGYGGTVGETEPGPDGELLCPSCNGVVTVLDSKDFPEKPASGK